MLQLCLEKVYSLCVQHAETPFPHLGTSEVLAHYNLYARARPIPGRCAFPPHSSSWRLLMHSSNVCACGCNPFIAHASCARASCIEIDAESEGEVVSDANSTAMDDFHKIAGHAVHASPSTG